VIRAVVFDVDGTLVDHLGAQRAGLEKLYAVLEEAQRVSLDEFIVIWHREDDRHWQQYQMGEITFVQQRLLRVKAVFDCLGECATGERAMAVFHTYLAAYETSWRLYKDVLPCLDALRGCRLAVISNGDSGQQRRKLERTGIASRFESVVISGDLGVSKPHRLYRRSPGSGRAGGAGGWHAGHLAGTGGMRGRPGGLARARGRVSGAGGECDC
jgi:putative hydrolase of the HAD superfamily